MKGFSVDVHVEQMTPIKEQKKPYLFERHT
jgi:hypothetical protein